MIALALALACSPPEPAASPSTSASSTPGAGPSTDTATVSSPPEPDTAPTGTTGGTADTAPPTAPGDPQETVWVFGVEEGIDRDCIFALDVPSLAHRALYCVPDGIDGTPGIIWRHSEVRDVDGVPLLGLIVDIGAIDGTPWGQGPDPIGAFDLVVLDLQSETAIDVWRWPDFDGPGGFLVESVVPEGPDRAAVVTRARDTYDYALERATPAGSTAIELPYDDDIALHAGLDDGLLVTLYGWLGWVDAEGAWLPLSRANRTTQAFHIEPLADGRVAYYDNTDVAGLETGELVIVTVGPPTTADARTKWSWGTYRDIQGLHAAADGTLYIASDDQVQHWNNDDRAVPNPWIDLERGSFGKGVAASPTGGLVAPSDDVLVRLDATGVATPTACAAPGSSYQSAAFSPSGASVFASSQVGVGFPHLQWCDPQGQPVDITGTTGLRGTVLAAP